jgi:hypothetical protein
MSTFGKKYLRKWDYFNHTMVEKRRFNSTPMDFQLELLKKWYPIGMKVHKVSVRSSYPENDVHQYDTDVYTIIEHVGGMGYHMVRIKSDVEILIQYPGRSTGFVFDNRHALNVVPIKEELRDMKLEKLLL